MPPAASEDVTVDGRFTPGSVNEPSARARERAARGSVNGLLRSPASWTRCARDR